MTTRRIRRHLIAQAPHALAYSMLLVLLLASYLWGDLQLTFG